MSLGTFVEAAALPIGICVVGIIVLFRIYAAQPSEEHSSGEGLSGGSM